MRQKPKDAQELHPTESIKLNRLTSLQKFLPRTPFPTPTPPSSFEMHNGSPKKTGAAVLAGGVFDILPHLGQDCGPRASNARLAKGAWHNAP